MAPPPYSKQHKEREGQSGAVLGPLERLKDQRMRKREQRGCKPFTRAAAKPPAEKAKEVVMQGVFNVCVCVCACAHTMESHFVSEEFVQQSASPGLSIVGPVCC